MPIATYYNITVVISFSGPSISAPYGMAVDYEENMLYWCDKNLNFLERVDLTSYQRKIILRNMTDCVSVDVYKQHVYWADL